MLPSLLFIAVAAARDGDAELAASLLHPGAVAGDVQRDDDRLRVHAGRRCSARRGIAPITSIAIGTLLGGVAQLALQWPTLRREGFRYRPVVDWRDDGLRRVLLLMGPGTIGMAATQVNLVVNNQLATGEGEGAVVVAELCLPPDVPADRPVRRLDRDRDASCRLAARHAEGPVGRRATRSRAASR